MEVKEIADIANLPASAAGGIRREKTKAGKENEKTGKEEKDEEKNEKASERMPGRAAAGKRRPRLGGIQ